MSPLIPGHNQSLNWIMQQTIRKNLQLTPKPKGTLVAWASQSAVRSHARELHDYQGAIRSWQQETSESSPYPDHNCQDSDSRIRLGLSLLSNIVPWITWDRPMDIMLSMNSQGASDSNSRKHRLSFQDHKPEKFHFQLNYEIKPDLRNAY